MTVNELTTVTTESIREALLGSRPCWVPLSPERSQAPDELVQALDAFYAGPRPAALAAASWLKCRAFDSHFTARAHLLVADRRVLAFYALASAQVQLRQRDRKRLQADGPVSVPAALVAWIAKDPRADVPGKALLLHAAAKARRAALLQATCVLVVDPFDDQTAAMWRQRFGFRPSAEPGERKRLWLPLHALD
jgi:hypothetical protein